MDNQFDRSKTLQELEQRDWGEPTYNSHLVTTCHRLRRIRLVDLTIEDLRIMIGQQISPQFLVPLAIEQLEADPLAEGDFYPGDLLSAVLRIDQTFWPSHPQLLERVRQVVSQVKPNLASIDEFDRRTVEKLLAETPDLLHGA